MHLSLSIRLRALRAVIICHLCHVQIFENFLLDDESRILTSF